MIKYSILGFIVGVILSGVVGALTIPNYVNNQRMQGENDGMLNAKREILNKVDKYFDAHDDSKYEELLFNFKTTSVLIVKSNESYTLKVNE